MDRYDPNISLPESGNMRDIPKWHSQKAVWVPFFISIDMSVWITLKSVLEADAAKQLHFQKNTDVSSQEPSANTQAHLKAQMTRVLLFIGLLTLFCSSPSSILPFQNPTMVVLIHHLVTTSLVGGSLSVLRVTSRVNCFSTCIMCTSCSKKCYWRGSWISIQPKSSSATMSISSSLFL